MRNIGYILILLFAFWGCSYSGFDPDSWDDGRDELKLHLSNSVISFLDNQAGVDTVVVRTNGESWNFGIDQYEDWCHGVQIDSMLILFVDSNLTEKSRSLEIEVNGFYNNTNTTKLIKVIQSANKYADTDTILNDPYIDYEEIIEMEWSAYNESRYWDLYEAIKYKIHSKFGLSDTYTLTQALLDRKLFIKAYDRDGSLNYNLLTDMTANRGFYFSAEGYVTNSTFGVLCWEFPVSDNYTTTKISLADGAENRDAQYCAFYVITDGKGNDFTIKLTLNVCKSLISQVDVVKCYNVEEVIAYQDSESTLYSEIDIDQNIDEIKSLIGGAPNCYYIAWGEDIDNDFVWRNIQKVGYWIGANGSVSLPKSPALNVEPKATGIFKVRCLPMEYSEELQPYEDLGFSARYLFVNSKTLKAVEVALNIKTTYYHHEIFNIVNQYSFDYEFLDENSASQIRLLDFKKSLNESGIIQQILNDIGGEPDLILLGSTFQDSTIFKNHKLYVASDGKARISHEYAGEVTYSAFYIDADFIYGSNKSVYSGDISLYFPKIFRHERLLRNLPVECACIVRYVNTKTELASDLYIRVLINGEE